MIIVADSGSSKTDWMAHTPEGVLTFSTQGINPYFASVQDIIRIVAKNKDLHKHASEVKEIYFFGAGCQSPDKREIVANALNNAFKNAYISVDHDLLGSAYATCGNSPGLACILGTGSNIAYYDGRVAHTGKHGLGYLLGDEASGTYFGKKLLQAYFHGDMPAALTQKFQEKYNLDKETVIESIYQKPFPNAYLASFSYFMFENKESDFIKNLLEQGFNDFIDINVKSYPNYRNLPCHFIGSVAYYYEAELRAAFAKRNILVGKILQKPIEGIFEFILQREGHIA